MPQPEMIVLIHVEPNKLGKWMVQYRDRIRMGIKLRRKDVLDLDQHFDVFELAMREGSKAEIAAAMESFMSAAAEFRLAQLN